jgi:hypothetical protein
MSICKYQILPPNSTDAQNPLLGRIQPSTTNIIHTRRLLLLPACLSRHVPHPPKLQILIPSARTNDVARRTQAAEKHPRIMRVPNLRDAFHARVGVQHDRVGGVPVRGEEFLAMWGPLDGGDLGWGAESV